MRRQLFALAVVALLSVPFIPARFGNVIETAHAVSTTIVISQFQVAGGTAADEFVELHNVGSTNFDLNGHRLVYRSAAGTSDVAVVNWTTSTIIPPGGYYLIVHATGYDGTTTADITFPGGGTGTFAAAGGGFAIRNGAANTGTIIDSVGYGTATNAFVEGTVEPAPAANTSAARLNNGCTDTDNNANDFANLNPSAPRNSATTAITCGGGPGVTLSINDVSQNEGSGGGTTAFLFTVSLSAPAGPGGVTFDICTADGTAQDDNPSTEDNDYAANCLTGQTIPSGSSTYSFTVNVNADTVSEPNETFFVNVTNVTGATVGDGQGQGTIVNDDITLILIHDVQGNGAASPLAGSTVTVRGVVTLLKSNGFFLQEEVGDNDADPNTSEGIFVFTSSAPTVAVADQATVTGSVVEFNGLTEITTPSVSVNSTGNTLPTAVTLDATILSPTAPPDQSHLEKYEAMRLSAAALRSVSPNDGFFDIETVLPTVPREQVFREPGIPAGNPIPPDPTSGTPDPNIPIWDRNPEKINLDTNGRAGATGTAYTSNVTFSNVAGPLDFSFGRYRLIPEAGFTASGNMSAVPVPTPNASEFTVVGYNIENFNNNATQRQKAADTVRNILHYPDIIGTVEIFNLAALQGLRDEINNDAVAAGDPNPMYEAYLIPTPVAGITQNVGFLVKTSRVSVTSVTQEREESTYVRPSDGSTDETHDRPPLVLNATVDPSGANPQPVVVVVNHTRSFIDIEMVAGDGPNVRAKRKAQAEDIADLFNDLQTANAGVPVIAVGDYNAFQFNNGYDDPLSVMRGNPTPDDQIVVDQSPDLVNPDFFNLIELVPAAERYSFFFDDDGAMQVLDHVLVNTSGRARNTRIHIAHVNADFPGSPAAAYATNASRVEHHSDHDPTISYFALGQPQTPGSLIISEFRLRGPGFTPVAPEEEGDGPAQPGGLVSNGGDDIPGASAPGTAQDNDEFVEFYNNTDADITVQTLDGSQGWALVHSTGGGTISFIIPNGTVIPARGHFLAANDDGYSLGGAAFPDLVHVNNIPDNTGIALFNTSEPLFFTTANRLDAVGPTTEADPLFKEGTGYTPLSPLPDTDHSFYRDLRAGTHRDTNDNASDFIFVEVNAGAFGPPQRLGAPGPENLSSPIQRNATVPLVLLDATQPAAAPPNRTRDFTSDPGNNSTFGTLTIRRRVTNNTGQNVTEMRFRIVNITAGPATGGTADVRARTSTDVVLSGIMDAATCAATGDGPPPCSVTVEGTVLEEPPSQPNGGGWNSTLRVPALLAPGESVNVQFLLGIEQTGAFRFFINVEVGTESVSAAPLRAPASGPVREKMTAH